MHSQPWVWWGTHYFYCLLCKGYFIFRQQTCSQINKELHNSLGAKYPYNYEPGNAGVHCTCSQKFYSPENNPLFACAITAIAFAITSIVQLHQLCFQWAKREKKKTKYTLLFAVIKMWFASTEKKNSVSWKMKLDYLGVFCVSCMKPKNFCDIKKRLELFDNLRLHSNFFSWATVITVQFSVVIREIILHLELIGHSLGGRSLEAFFS